MKGSKIVKAAAIAALALMVFAGSASATTLTTNGVLQTGAVALEATLTGSATTKDTSNTFANTCTASTIKSKTSTTTGTGVGGPVESLSFSKCTHETVEVVKTGTLSTEKIGATTNGTVRSTGAEWKVPSTIFGSTVLMICTTSETDIGTLTGKTTGTSVLDINAVLNCGSFLPSAKWEAAYNITGHAIAVEA
jgi:hypothetical protein